MTLRSSYLLAAGTALWMAHALPAQEPSRLGVVRGHAVLPRPQVSANQQFANIIAEHLRQSGQLRGYTIDIVYREGIAELTGRVADQSQRDEAIRIVQGVPGVERVRDRLLLASGVIQVQNPLPPVPNPVPLPVPAAPANPVIMGGMNGANEPMPIYQTAPGSGVGDLPPNMPPYAWPTYAPYNNYSRVAYPTAYPYNAWPFIGPCYPFPKVPLGWRSVKLEWEDGHWWFSKTATNHDWWRLKYW